MKKYKIVDLCLKAIRFFGGFPNASVNWIGTSLFGKHKEYRLPFGQLQRYGIIAVIYLDQVFRDQPLKLRLLSIIKWQWQTPSVDEFVSIVDEVLLQNLFGQDEDFGPTLLKINKLLGRRKWDLSAMTESDHTKAKALWVHGQTVRLYYRDLETEPTLHLEIASRNLDVAMLSVGISHLFPVVSITYFIELNTGFAFNSIRKFSPNNANRMIALLYEILFLQQKIATGLNEYLFLAHKVRETKTTASLTQYEVKAIMHADLLFVHLKATIEKTLAFIGSIYGVNNIMDKKHQKQRIAAVAEKMPVHIKDIAYGKLILDFIDESGHEQLGKYRTGILHKLGIKELQPHTYVGVASTDLPFLKLFAILQDQHAKNTMIILSALALLTDEIMGILLKSALGGASAAGTSPLDNTVFDSELLSQIASIGALDLARRVERGFDAKPPWGMDPT